MYTYFHLFNRGVNGKKIYFEPDNYSFFLERLKCYKDKFGIKVLCYCLMPNHFHLFVKQPLEYDIVGSMIGSLTNSYTKSINKKFNRTGVLFGGRTKNRIIENEEYFIWLFKYILLNPVEAKLVSAPEEWEYSSAREYLGLSNDTFTEQNDILSQFDSIKHMREFLISRDVFDYGKFK